MPSSVSSAYPKKKIPELRDSGWRMVLTIVLRALLGIVFIVSGWAKLIDPWGFVIKTGEYLAVWNFRVPHEVILTACVSLAGMEFLAGVFMAAGCFRRMGVWMASAIMLGLLPLSLYIALVNPVSDCGCFGDLFHPSNWMTFFKNVLICAGLLWLLLYNRRVMAFFPFSVQWLVAAGATVYALWISFMGYNVQPLADFRPYPVGSAIFEGSSNGVTSRYIYEKDGRQQTFSLDSLPDDDWAFVGVDSNEDDIPLIAVRDFDGEVVNDLIVDDGYQLWLIVNAPNIQSLSRAHFLHALNRILQQNDNSLTVVVAGNVADANRWKNLVRPEFDVYYAEDTALQQLVRGTSALILTNDGNIVWKRTFGSLNPEMADNPDVIDYLIELPAPDNGRPLMIATVILLGVIVFAGVLGYRRLIFRTLPQKDIKDSGHR